MQWNMDHSRHNIGDVAAGYAALPKYDSKAEYAWKQLAEESKEHADYIRQHLNVTETDNPEPYDTSEDMIRDIRNNRNFVVSTANADHPIWTPQDNINFRIVHDVFGHAATEGDFGWHGENDACSTHFALSSPHAQKALATECLGQTGYAIDRGGFTDQRVGFIPGLHEGLSAANEDTPVPTRAQLMQRALYGPPKESKWKIAQDANRMYRQHTDGAPVAETTFESIQNEDTSDEHEDEIKIINGKKWRMVRRKNNPQPDTYKDPIGGWGFYSNFNIDDLIEKFTPRWNIITSNATPPLEQEKLWDYAQTIPKNYILVKDKPMIEKFMRFGLLPIVGIYSHHADNNLSLTKPPKNQGFNRPIDFSAKHSVYFWDPRERHIMYGIAYTLNNSEAYEDAISDYNDKYDMNVSSDPTDLNYDPDILSEDEIKTKSVPTYVESIHYVDPNPPKGVSGSFYLQPAEINDNGNYSMGNEFVLWGRDELGKPRSQHKHENAYIDKFNQKYPRFTMNLLRWMKDTLPGPFGADIVNPKLRDVVERHPKLVQFSKWKLSVPPAERAKEFGEGYEEAPAPSSEEIEERYKYNKDPRGHRWQLNKENLERLYNHPEWPLESKYNVFPLSLEQAQLKGREKPDLTHWNRAALGTHESPQGKNRSGFIYINPLISPESANEALWHELQHAYQHQEERFTKELRDAYFDPTKLDPRLTDEEVARKFEEEYLKHPMEIDANLFADFMRRYPIIEESDPVYKENWVGRAAKDMDIKDAIDKYYQEYGSKRRLPLPSIQSKWKKVGVGLWDLNRTEPSHYFDTKVVEEIPVSVALQMLDLERGKEDYERENIQDLTQHITQHGVLEPIIIDFNIDTNTAFVTEGNHRVQVAKQLGMEWIPARGVRNEGSKSRFKELPVRWQGIQTDHAGNLYIPPHFPPHMIGLPVKEKVKGFEDGWNYNGWETKESKWIRKEAPARSKAQFRYMQAICNGSIKPPKGMTRAQACEYVEGQSPKDLPEKKSKLDMQQEMEESLIKAGFSQKAAILIALDNMSKLSYWVDGYHAAVALRDPETDVWHMDVGFNDKLTHGGVTADYINDLGTKAMRKAVADKDSRTDYYNYHTARGLYNPVTKDFIHMSHPDFWNEAEYNFKHLDQDERDRMEAFWRQLAEQNNIELDSIRVLNNQTGHLEDLNVADLEMPEEVSREMRMRERNRPLTPWEIAQGGYDTKTGSKKEAHWIEGFSAAIINQHGKMEVAPPGMVIVDGNGNVIDEDDTPWYATHWDIGGYPQYRGLYNHKTGELIHMTSPKEHENMSPGYEYLSKDQAINPLEHETYWRDAANQSNIPIRDFKLMYEKDEDEYGDEPLKKLWHGENKKEDFNLLYPEEFMPKTSKWKKRSHWLEDYYAAVITPSGKMKVSEDWNQFHGMLAGDLGGRQYHRGLYNKETGELLHMTSPEEWKKLENSWDYSTDDTAKQWPIGFEWFNSPEHFISPYKNEKEWLKAAEDAGIPVSGVKMFSGEPEGNPYVGYDVNRYNRHSPAEVAQMRMSKWKTSKQDAWEAVLDGELGHDILTTGSWEEVKKQTLKWLKQLKNGYINKKNPHDNKKIDPEAKEQDGHAIEDLKLYEEKKRWSFHFDHGKHPYDLIIQPVGYKESKWKKKSHWIEGFHSAIINQNGEMEVVNSTNEKDPYKPGADANWGFNHWQTGGYPFYRGLYNHETGELIHMTSPEEYVQIEPEIRKNSLERPEYLYQSEAISPSLHEDAWRKAAEQSGISINNFSLLYGKENEEKKSWNKQNQKEDFYLAKPENNAQQKTMDLSQKKEKVIAHFWKKILEEIADWKDPEDVDPILVKFINMYRNGPEPDVIQISDLEKKEALFELQQLMEENPEFDFNINPLNPMDKEIVEEEKKKYLKTSPQWMLRSSKKSKWKKRSHWIEGFHAAVIDPDGKMHIAGDWEDVHQQTLIDNGWIGSDLSKSYRGLYNPDTGELFHMTSPVEKMTFGEYATSPNHLSDIENHEDVWREAASKSGVPVNDFKGLYKVDEYDEDGWRMDPLWYQKNPKEMFGYISPKQSKWKKAENKKRKTHPKFQTSLSDHQRSVKKYGPLKTHKTRKFKKRSSLNEEQSRELFQYEPHMYHDVAAARSKEELNDQINTVRSILQNGILPKEQTGVSEYDDWLTSRPDHVYLGRKNFYSRKRPPAIKIDMSKVDPSTIKPDEDIYHAFGFSERGVDMFDLKSMPFEEEHRNNPDYTLGQWMEDHSHLDTPNNVFASHGLNNSLAVKGGVPSDALSINDEWVDYMNDRYGIDILKLL